MAPSAAARRYLQSETSVLSLPRVEGVHSSFLSMVTLTFDFDIETCLSEGPNKHVFPANLVQIHLNSGFQDN